MGAGCTAHESRCRLGRRIESCGLLPIVTTLAAALLATRIVGYGLTQIFKPGPALAASEHVVTCIGWAVAALLLLGWLQPVTAAMDSIALTAGG